MVHVLKDLNSNKLLGEQKGYIISETTALRAYPSHHFVAGPSL